MKFRLSGFLPVSRSLFWHRRPFVFYSIITLSLVLTLGGCMSQEVIERACYQTLSASTPVCFCPEVECDPAPVETEAPPVEVVPTNDVIIPPPTGRLIFRGDFESGNFALFEGDDAEFFGKGVYYNHSIVTKPAIGQYSAALSIGSGNTTAAYLFTYRVPSTPLGIYSADFYVPGNILTGDWWNVWQWKSEDNSFELPVISLNLINHGASLYAHLFYTPGGRAGNEIEEITQSDPIPFPTDRWVNITGAFFAASDETGYVEIYQDGIKIFDVKGIPTKPGGKNVYWSVNSYADRIAPDPATIYLDNISIYESP